MASPSDPKLNARVVKLYTESDLSLRQIARRVRRSKSRVQQILVENDVPRRPVGTGKESHE